MLQIEEEGSKVGRSKVGLPHSDFLLGTVDDASLYFIAASAPTFLLFFNGPADDIVDNVVAAEVSAPVGFNSGDSEREVAAAVSIVGGEGEGVSTFILSAADDGDVAGGAGHEVAVLSCRSL